MENMENLEVVETPENVVQPTEEPAQPKLFTQEEVNEIVGKAKARTRAKVEKEHQRQYGGIEALLKAGTGKESIGEIEESLRDFYQQQGIPVQEKPAFSEEDIRTLAISDADEIIDAGYEEVVDEVNRLASIGAEKMTPRERAMFERLANYRNSMEREKALAEIGVPESVYNSQKFKTFAGQFNKNVPITDVYKLYEKTGKTSTVEPIGSMKNGSHGEEKTYYSPEDVDKLRPEDLDNPVIFQRVRESMKRW